jgi:cytochrome c nitrite reductase small subunit
MKIIKKIIPPDKWKLPVAIIMGIFVGLGIYTVMISHAPSYLSDSPTTCINCHIMQPQYASWFHSSHRRVTTCNDCHVPHDNFFKKYFFKGKDGLRHATMFTLRLEPQVIQIKDDGINVVQENCKRCHIAMNQQVKTLTITGKNYTHGEGKLCWECHRNVPHGTVNSLSSSPNNLVPKLESPVPEWLKELMNK